MEFDGLRPMLAIEGEVFDSPDHCYELKWDGYRVLVLCDEQVTVMSRNGGDLTNQFPEVATLKVPLSARPVVFDGELVVLEQDGRPNFARMQRRGRVTKQSSIEQRMRTDPISFVVFDLLFHQGNDLCMWPLHKRRALLAELCQSLGPLVVFSRAIEEKGAELFGMIVDQGLEGMMAKAKDSPYIPGRRSKAWIKVKNRLTTMCVILGFLPIPASLGFRSLCLGQYHNECLAYVGNVGSGFRSEEIQVVYQTLVHLEILQSALPRIPRELKVARWVKPILVCQIEYTEFTPEGRLRQPVYKGMRFDRRPKECIYGE